MNLLRKNNETVLQKVWQGFKSEDSSEEKI